MVLLVFLESEKKKIEDFLIGKSAQLAMILMWACRVSSGEDGGVGFILGSRL